MESTSNLAVFCDFENLAIGAQEANFGTFDIGVALERLLDKGKIIYKKAYCDWERYKDSRKDLHENGFELVEIPHVSYSGKNSADIRMVVDALDLCYTKSHVDTFVLLSGDSDFSPLVSKLRENNKEVIGLGVKKSSSNLLVENCDEFIYYDDLVKKKRTEANKLAAKKQPKKLDPANSAAEAARRQEAIKLVVETIDGMIGEKEGTLWGPTVRRTIKRKKPSFSENYYGFKNFNQILQDASEKGYITISRDAETGHFGIHSVDVDLEQQDTDGKEIAKEVIKELKKDTPPNQNPE